MLARTLFRPAFRRLAPLVGLVLLGACGDLTYIDQSRTGCDSAFQHETALYFGLSGPDGVIGDNAWAAFREEHLVGQFSDGFTVLGGSGHWRDLDTGEGVSESSRVVLLLHEGRAEDDAAIEAVAEAYKTRFDQQSVLRVDTAVCATF